MPTDSKNDQTMLPVVEYAPNVNPAMIVLARESRGLTQAELARQLGTSQATISKIEGGLAGVSADMVVSLSDELKYPLGFFHLRDQIVGPGIGELFHRKRQTIPNKVLAKIHAHINIRRMNVERLLRAAELPVSQIPHIDPDEYDGRIEDIAREVRAAWGLPHGPVINVCRAVEDAGGLIVPCHFETQMVDAISQWVPRLPPLFFVNMNVPHDRLRLNLAHELAHLVLHRLPRPEAEEEAMRFAAEFLMPERDIRPELSDLTIPKLASLKLRWRVSMAALARRARELGKLTDSRYRSLIIKMNTAGFKTREPVELDVRDERPSLLQELIDAHRKDLGYSIADISELLSLTEQEVKSFYFGRRDNLRAV
jgi:Zn-dependent peptidase ImmA (M78 family)/transcriptional regulator with XRE-family HTH domain